MDQHKHDLNNEQGHVQTEKSEAQYACAMKFAIKHLKTYNLVIIVRDERLNESLHAHACPSRPIAMHTTKYQRHILLLEYQLLMNIVRDRELSKHQTQPSPADKCTPANSLKISY